MDDEISKKSLCRRFKGIGDADMLQEIAVSVHNPKHEKRTGESTVSTMKLISELRERLHIAALRHDLNLLHPDVLALSMALDVLINQQIKDKLELTRR